jgi:hypothetical protein
MVVCTPPHTVTESFFVDVQLYSTAEEEMPILLDGIKSIRVKNEMAAFNRLKITQTSQQAGGTKYKLRFALKIFVGNEYQYVPGAVVFSDPIEVFSHSIYITMKTGSGRL